MRIAFVLSCASVAILVDHSAAVDLKAGAIQDTPWATYENALA